jgi:hypothetical protein
VLKIIKILFLTMLLHAIAVSSASALLSDTNAVKKMYQESTQLTFQAQDELDKHHFDSAFKLVQKAIKLNPSNEKAKNMYMNLSEFISIPQNNVPQKQKIKEKKNIDKKVSETTDIYKNKPAKPAEEKKPEESGKGFIQFGLLCSFGKSDYLDYINSAVVMGGGRAEGGYLFPLKDYQIGFSADYSLYPLKIKGDSNIDFMIHKFNAFLCGQQSFFPDNNRSLILGIRGGYHLFLLNNKKNEGVYYFRQAASAAAGFYVSDPLFRRFIKNDSIMPFGIEASFTVIPLIKKGDNALAMEYSIAGTYTASTLEFLLGWRMYQISNGQVHERFSDIEFATRYLF